MSGADVTLVCGGGGVWGVAWMTGIARGLADGGADLRRAGAFIGTSAGSVVATQLATGLDLEMLYLRQVDPARQPREPAAAPDAMARLMQTIQQPIADPQARRAALCRLALEAATISYAERRAAIAERLGLPDERWPEAPLQVTAVDAESLEGRAFDRASGVCIVDAVAASCAVPAVWPPAEIDGRRYVDGGFWMSADNAELAQGARKVVILSPTGALPAMGGASSLLGEVERLSAGGAQVVVITPDQASFAAMQPGPLDPATRKPAAEAGRAQASREAPGLKMFAFG